MFGVFSERCFIAAELQGCKLFLQIKSMQVKLFCQKALNCKSVLKQVMAIYTSERTILEH